jgi:hypothetical protein
MDAIRYARIDLGVVVNIDVDALATQPDGLSSQHFVVGAIEYGDGEIGRLVYVKASMTGDESATIRQYRELHPAFPQESSSNQFFTEAQFEAYRALGEHVGRELAANWMAIDLEDLIERDIFNQELA